MEQEQKQEPSIDTSGVELLINFDKLSPRSKKLASCRCEECGYDARGSQHSCSMCSGKMMVCIFVFLKCVHVLLFFFVLFTRRFVFQKKHSGVKGSVKAVKRFPLCPQRPLMPSKFQKRIYISFP